ncbi:MAG: D-cysteine desulfhydrase family protein [Tepidanaerobacter acetatoxydans]|uniref:1-aminocyclopropane-1-carboxylate deaminase/D-cysteine desulfhydrase n=1 Tax=Tepidanaerobacter TaxID=499228 RepID=UPI0025D32942|nr:MULTISPECIES: D-cysteine desulfhydrase family protein [Tepidanaerobacter]NLU10564.1 D-cysteine desulfhydrase family protein [Tepidanaerobacter acetatoxydans]
MISLNMPRIKLCQLPTDLEPASNLSEKLENVTIYFKRDDNTGLAMGGNKGRKLEFLLADAIKKEADVIITTGSIQSNHTRMTCAACRKLGLDVILVLKGKKPLSFQGNLLLEKLMNADIRFVDALSYDDIGITVNYIMSELKAEGKKPYFIPVGGSVGLGACGYVDCALELFNQADKQNLRIDYIVNAVGSGGTSAGLEVGVRLAKKNSKIVGISVDAEKTVFKQDISRIAQDCASLLEADLKILPEDITVFDEYIGEDGYGKPSRQGIEAIKLVAETEGIILDPVYSGKAMAGLIDLVKKGFFEKGSNIVFIHTGGTPALFDMLVNN